jgi:putative ABC transport system permease protein
VNLLQLHRSAFRALSRNLMRTGLTMLGVVIGVSAVICTLAIGDGATSRLRSEIASAGANMIWIEAGSVNRHGFHSGAHGTKTLTVDDARAIARGVPLVKDVTPNVDTRTQVVYGDQNWFAPVRGIAPAYLAVRDWPVAIGGMFGDQDVERAADVCVLGQTVVEMLFRHEDPLGKTIRVRDHECRVLGVLAPKGQSAFGQDQDDIVLMPYTTVQKKIKGQYWLDDIMMSAVSGDAVAPAEVQIADLLRIRHRLRPGADDDFNLRHPTEIAQAVESSTQVMELLLAAVASVSLVVGGVGIMNIMLVSVTERTREIGLQLAVGARGRDVLRQFALEALIISLAGGAVGVGLGFLGTRVIADVFAWPTRVSANAVVLAVAFSATIGVVFGYYPARKAAQLDPIDALRYE